MGIELEKEVENVTLLLESKRNKILEEKFKIDQNLERLMEKQEKIADDLRQKKLEKAEALVKQKEINEQLKVAEEGLAEMEAAFQKFNDEAASVEKMAENIPKISETRILMYKISRLTFD